MQEPDYMACIMIRDSGRAGSPSCMFSDFHDSADVNQPGQSRLLAVVGSVPKSRVIDVDNVLDQLHSN